MRINLTVLAAAGGMYAGCSGHIDQSQSSVNADNESVIELHATDGTGIYVRYQSETQGTDFDHYVFANDISFYIDSDIEAHATRIVFIEKCTNGGTGVFQCDAHHAEGTLVAHYPENCHHESNYDNNYYASFAPRFLISSEGHGMLTSTCTQELAVVRDGVWLTDPVNGTHNFKFRFD